MSRPVNRPAFSSNAWPDRVLDRRSALRAALAGLAAVGAAPSLLAGQAPAAKAEPPVPRFRISLAQWSLHRALRAGTIDPLDFPAIAIRDYGIGAVEYVNQFYMAKTGDTAYFAELRKRADDAGVKSLLIMCDGIGELGDPDDAKRTKAVEGHYPWVEHAKTLGCHSIRVNAASSGTWDEQRDLAADGLRRLTVFAAERDLNVIVENHGGISSNGKWLAETIRKVDHPRCGTLPDFGNFSLGGGKTYDRYEGVAEMMPFAKAVSAKSMDFDEQGYETTIDYPRMIAIVLAAGYHGHLGIEYEGDRLSEPEGIRATKRLLEKLEAVS